MTPCLPGMTNEDAYGPAGSAVVAEQRTTQPAQWREQRHPRTPAVLRARVIVRDQLLHQHRGALRLPLGDGRAAQHREMAVEARAGRTASAFDRRHSWPAPYRYLLHDTPHPYEGTRPGQSNPTSPSRHPRIPGSGFTTTSRVLTIPFARKQILGPPLHPSICLPIAPIRQARTRLRGDPGGRGLLRAVVAWRDQAAELKTGR